MTEPVTVLLDPDGTLPDWMFVLVEAPTGVWYQHQYGGTANRERRAQGFLVPAHGFEARAALDAVFLRELRGAGVWGGEREPTAAVLRRVAEAVALVRYWTDDRGPVSLALDGDRASEADEGWVPVRTPDGPGVLLWPNSD